MIRIRSRGMAVVVVLLVLVAATVLTPIPDPAQLRTWALSAGSAAALLLFLAYALITVAPVPRTVFTLAAGLLLGTVVGVAVAIVATAVSSVLGFALARWARRGWPSRYLEVGSVRAVDSRLAGGGWLAVASLRLIPLVPFSAMNYCCGLSSVRVRPYLVGTVIGSLPGTVAVVVFGDTLAGTASPAFLGISAGCALLGAAGLYVAIRRAQPVAVPSKSPAR